MKKIFFIVLLIASSIPATARHVAGGELFYEFISSTDNTVTYQLTLRLFRECESNGPQLENEQVYVGVYEDGRKFGSDVYLPIVGGSRVISLNTGAFPCLVGSVSVCYQVALYTSQVTLPINSLGYTLSTLGCCRVEGISNLFGSNPNRTANIGNNYVTYIPGRNSLPTGFNNSPQFNVKDTALVCANKKFKLDFGATDYDRDSLTYSFCDAFTSGQSGGTIRPTPTLSMISLPYAMPYSGQNPLGNAVFIDPATGIISGVAPPSGRYVVNVCITEWRNGKPFNQHRKDFLLKVQSCDFVEADLPDKIIQCKDSIVHFENGSTSSAITDYLWEFGDKTKGTSTKPVVDYPYADTGRYQVKLTVHGPKGCVGMDSTEVVVYPGFSAGFGVAGSCYFNPYQFTDSTYTRYGVVSAWRWDLGDQTSGNGYSNSKNPAYKYPTAGSRLVKLVSESSKGCIDSIQKEIIIRDKPLLNLPFKDTLICSIDTLAIPVNGPGAYSWLPNKNILYGNTSSPLVFPKDTTQYFVTVNDNGCTNTDTVTINVLQSITVKLAPDTMVCQSDPVQLRPISQGLQYTWTSSSGEQINAARNPIVRPVTETRYFVTAHLGKCEARADMLIRVVPYPFVTLGADTVVCPGTRAFLRGNTVASSISWSPANSLSNAFVRNPVAAPTRTTQYIATVRDTLGCPKPYSDTITVTVAPPIHAFAGRDTTAVSGQPLQLRAEGGVQYAWSPESYLTSTSISNPIAIFPPNLDSIRYYVHVTDQYGCSADDDLVVRAFRTGPEIFIPSAFTPNGDGKNDVLKPVTAGIATLQFFRVYNRYGQVVYSTSETGKGWDGVFNGYPQPSGTYVYQAQGTDYNGRIVFRKGTVVLIR